MFGAKPNDKDKIIEQQVNKLNKKLDEFKISDSLENNIQQLKKFFEDDETLITRVIENRHDKSIKCYIAYCDGVVNSTIINENIIKPIMLAPLKEPEDNIIDLMINKVILINEVKKTTDFNTVIRSITYGDTVLFINNASEAIILNTKGFQTRGVTEPDNEKVLNGPREGFCEALLINLSLIRRKLRTNSLKMKYKTFGERSKTNACICYIDGIVNKEILNELYNRLDKIKIDAVIDSNYIKEMIKDSPYSPFPSVGYTERPDVVVGKLLEGRIAIFIDGTPTVLTVPLMFIEDFQSGEDYYTNFYYSSFSRMLRILGFLLTILVPSFYVAVVAYHHEMLPTPLLINIAIERQTVPFPAALEAFLMIILFDIIRETGIRVPMGIGQALSIVGALVIGQAAVEAKLVAAPMIIVVGVTGITNLLVPKLGPPVIYARMFILLLTSLLGFVGMLVGMSFVIIHILNLRSFGVPQFTSLKSFSFQDSKDIIIRAPWWKMIMRPTEIANDKIRMSSNEDKEK